MSLRASAVGEEEDEGTGSDENWRGNGVEKEECRDEVQDGQGLLIDTVDT